VLDNLGKIQNFIRENKDWIKNKDRKAVLFATPVHGNLGDHAIALAERQLLEKYIPEKQILEIHVSEKNMPMWLYGLFIGKSPVFVTGGGFLGNLWMDEETMVLDAVKYFKRNPIIIFPQTVYYEESEKGRQAKDKAYHICGKAKNVFLFVREKNCYKNAAQVYPKERIGFAPDMALRLITPEYECKREGVLCCLRRDKEGVLDGENKAQLIQALKKHFDDKIEYTDTVISRNVSIKERERLLQQKWKEFSKYRLVITDRLHGMIFALLTKTPCIAINNSSGKVKAVYEVIKDNSYIKYVNHTEEIEGLLLEMTKCQKVESNWEDIRKKYAKLERLLNKIFDRE